MAERASATASRLPPPAAEQAWKNNSEFSAGRGERGEADRARAGGAQAAFNAYSEHEAPYVAAAPFGEGQPREFLHGASLGQENRFVLNAIEEQGGLLQQSHQEQMRAIRILAARVGGPSDLSPHSACLAELVSSVFIKPVLEISRNLYKNSPVILLASGIALAVNYFGAPRYPVLAASSDTSLQGSVVLAKLVATTFLFKSALEPFLKHVDHHKQKTKTIYHQRAVHYFNPLALSLIVAYARGWNVKPLEGTLYSVGLFACMKLLGKGFDYVCNWKDGSSAEHAEVEYQELLEPLHSAED